MCCSAAGARSMATTPTVAITAKSNALWISVPRVMSFPQSLVNNRYSNRVNSSLLRLARRACNSKIPGLISRRLGWAGRSRRRLSSLPGDWCSPGDSVKTARHIGIGQGGVRSNAKPVVVAGHERAPCVCDGQQVARQKSPKRRAQLRRRHSFRVTLLGWLLSSTKPPSKYSNIAGFAKFKLKSLTRPLKSSSVPKNTARPSLAQIRLHFLTPAATLCCRSQLWRPKRE